jgi:hypothetical protein
VSVKTAAKDFATMCSLVVSDQLVAPWSVGVPRLIVSSPLPPSHEMGLAIESVAVRDGCSSASDDRRSHDGGDGERTYPHAPGWVETHISPLLPERLDVKFAGSATQEDVGPARSVHLGDVDDDLR